MYRGKFGLVFHLPPDLREVYQVLAWISARFNGDDSGLCQCPYALSLTQRGDPACDAKSDHTVRPDLAETVAVLKESIAELAFRR